MTEFQTLGEQFFQQSNDQYYDYLARTYFPHSKLYQTTPCSTIEDEPWYYGPPKFAYYTEVAIPIDLLETLDFNQFQQLVTLLIGNKGANLIDITIRSGAHYIWFNNEKKFFQIWGDTLPCVIAQGILQKQIKDYHNYLHN